MIGTEYIRAAVELADDTWPWDFHKKEAVLEFSGYDIDALAAQLVRQVDDKVIFRVTIEPTGTDITCEGQGTLLAQSRMQESRTMATIKAIVDSGVLES